MSPARKLNPDEKQRIQEVLVAADRAGRQRRLEDGASLLLICVLLLCGLGFVYAKVVHDRESMIASDAASARADQTDIEIGRDRKIITFLCTDLDEDDAYRLARHQLDTFYNPKRDAYHLSIDRIFAQREAQAAIRSRECASLANDIAGVAK